MKRFLKISQQLLAISLTVILIVSGILYQFYVHPAVAEAEDTISSNFLADLPKTTVITDRNGAPLYYLYKDQDRIIVPGSQINDSLKKAVISAEDDRFYEHGGFDPISIARAIGSDLSSHQIVSGGSTLEMQLVKNITGDSRSTITRKIKEAYLATLLEQHYTKDQILTMYLNVIPLGGEVYGGEAASELYFHKHASELSIPEAATLAALITSPNFYANSPKDLKTRRNYVLSRMFETNRISKDEYNAAIATDTPLGDPAVPFKAQHFTDLVIDQLKAKYGDDIYKKGYTVTTSLDLHAQELAEQSVKDNINVLHGVRANGIGMVVMDPKTGDVLALVGSPNYSDPNGGQVNLATAPLSYGSTGKSLFYSFLMEQDHWSPGAILWDVKTNFSQPGVAKPYTPSDYDGKFFGPMTIREALGTSRNIPAVKAVEIVGVRDVIQRLHDLGISSFDDNPEQYGPAIAIGGAGIPLTQMTGAYTALANGGKVNPANFIDKITDPSGKTIDQFTAPNRPEIKPEVAYEVSDILQDNNARKREFGLNSPMVIPGHTVAAKTGTSDDFRSALTIGYTPDVVTGVIVANNDNSPLVQGAIGAMAAAPFFHSFMVNYLADKPNDWYAKPDDVNQTQFATVTGKVNDLTAPWQSPTDRFTKAVTEADNVDWTLSLPKSSQQQVASSDSSQPNPAATPADQPADPQPAPADQGRQDNGNPDAPGQAKKDQ